MISLPPDAMTKIEADVQRYRNNRIAVETRKIERQRLLDERRAAKELKDQATTNGVRHRESVRFQETINILRRWIEDGESLRSIAKSVGKSTTTIIGRIYTLAKKLMSWREIAEIRYTDGYKQKSHKKLMTEVLARWNRGERPRKG
jgi:response regulator of citrate/malate metabolism